MSWEGEERRVRVTLTEDQINEIVQKTVAQVFEQIYAEVGKSVVRKALWIIGALALTAMAWLVHKDAIKLP